MEGMTFKNRRITKLVQADFDRGMTSESFVEEALQKLAFEDLIDHYYRAEPDGELDRQGIDFLVYPEPDWIIPLQVKSSFGGMQHHFIEYGRRIPCVIVDIYDIEELSKKILIVLGLSTDVLFSV